jgi:hypothetical protein
VSGNGNIKRIYLNEFFRACETVSGNGNIKGLYLSEYENFNWI